MSDDISPDEYYSLVERHPLSSDDQRLLAERDKFHLKYGIYLGLAANADQADLLKHGVDLGQAATATDPGHKFTDLSESRIDQVYQNRLDLNRKNGVKL